MTFFTKFPKNGKGPQNIPIAYCQGNVGYVYTKLQFQVLACTYDFPGDQKLGPKSLHNKMSKGVTSFVNNSLEVQNFMFRLFDFKSLDRIVIHFIRQISSLICASFTIFICHSHYLSILTSG